MERKIVVPKNWQIPDAIRYSIAEVPGTQRALSVEDHLILHNLPTAHSVQRELMIYVAFGSRFDGPEPLWFRMLFSGLIGCYMGSYFWIMSAERILVE